MRVAQGRRQPVYAWIGIQSDGQRVQTTTGEPLLFRSLHPHQEKSDQMQPVFTDGVMWRLADPTSMFNCLIEWDGIPDRTTDIYDGSAEHVVQIDGRTYALVDEPMKWIEARDRCREMGGILASVTSPKVERELRKLMRSAQLSQQDVWVGGKVYDKEFVWLNGEPADYTNWLPGHPIPYQNATLLTENGWKTDYANSRAVRHPFICMWFGPSDKSN